MTDHAERERRERLARGWDEAAAGYDAYYVPRFAPWVSAAVRAVAAPDLPAGPVLVPCCGTLPELAELRRVLPDREVMGIDLSAGMVALARARAADDPRVTVVEGDAATLDPRWTAGCAAVVSVFGLQQLPEPDAALRSWAGALPEGGRLSVVYWPTTTEEEGPFARLQEVLRPHVEPGDGSWEERLAPALAAAGMVVERDQRLSYAIAHPSAAAFFDAHSRHGPGRPLADARGAAFVAELRETYLRGAPDGEWRHRPHARHLVARRVSPASR